jgi:DNA-binding CsgD family transcriptional regulator
VNRDSTTFRVTEEGERQDLSPILQDEVYRIGREVLRDPFRHARARHDDRVLRMRIHDDGKGIDPRVLGEGGRAAELADHATEDALSTAKIDVLRLIAGGNANKEIACQLSITEETVKSHITHILAKLGANDRTHAVTLALKRGIIEL